MRGLTRIIARSRLILCERGATAIEYGLIIALVVLVMIAALGSVADKTTGMWGNVANEVSAH